MWHQWPDLPTQPITHSLTHSPWCSVAGKEYLVTGPIRRLDYEVVSIADLHYSSSEVLGLATNLWSCWWLESFPQPYLFLLGLSGGERGALAFEAGLIFWNNYIPKTIHMHIQTHACTHTDTCMCTHRHMHVHTRTHACTHCQLTFLLLSVTTAPVYTCMYSYMHRHMHVQLQYAQTHACTATHTDTCMYSYMHRHMHVHTYFSAALSTSFPLETNAIDQSTQRANPSFNSSSAMFPACTHQNRTGLHLKGHVKKGEGQSHKHRTGQSNVE